MDDAIRVRVLRSGGYLSLICLRCGEPASDVRNSKGYAEPDDFVTMADRHRSECETEPADEKAAERIEAWKAAEAKHGAPSPLEGLR